MTKRAFHVVYLPNVQADIAHVLDWTENNFGVHQVTAYEELIKLTLHDISHNADSVGRLCPEVHPSARVLSIARPGRSASHVFLYRVRGDIVEIAAFLYDAMDLVRHMPSSWTK